MLKSFKMVTGRILVLLICSHTDIHNDKLIKTILSQFSGDHVTIVTNGVRSAGYLILDFVRKGSPLPQEIVTPFLRSINHSSNDVKVIKLSTVRCSS